jgi:hypothetical protein
MDDEGDLTAEELNDLLAGNRDVGWEDDDSYEWTSSR